MAAQTLGPQLGAREHFRRFATSVVDKFTARKEMAPLATDISIDSLDWSICKAPAASHGQIGNDSAFVTQPGGAPIKIRLSQDGMRAPFGASSFQGEAGKPLNLELSIEDNALLEWARKLDEWFLATLGETYGMDRQQMLFAYKPIVKTRSGQHPPLLKTKLSLQRVKCWGPPLLKDGVYRHPPVDPAEVDWTHSRLSPIVQVRRVWKINGMVGVSLDVSDVLVTPSSENTQCPF